MNQKEKNKKYPLEDNQTSNEPISSEEMEKKANEELADLDPYDNLEDRLKAKKSKGLEQYNQLEEESKRKKDDDTLDKK